MSSALVLDVDGVVSPARGSTAWGDDVDGGPGYGPVPVSPALNARLDALGERRGVVPAWLTSWGRDLRAGMRFPGADWEVVAHDSEAHGPPVFDESSARRRAGERWGDLDWWKWWALDAWLDDHPAIDTVVWCDDHLALPFFPLFTGDETPPELVLTRATYARVELERRGLRALVLGPATTVGLTPADLELIETFVEDVGSQGPPPQLPDEPERPSSLPRERDGDYWQARRCFRCDEDAWYLRYGPFFVTCTECRRTTYGPHDITDLFPPRS